MIFCFTFWIQVLLGNNRQLENIEENLTREFYVSSENFGMNPENLIFEEKMGHFKLKFVWYNLNRIKVGSKKHRIRMLDRLSFIF